MSLHLYEPRYKLMMKRIVDAERSFLVRGMPHNMDCPLTRWP